MPALERLWARCWPFLLVAAAVACAYRSSLRFELIGDAEFLIKNNQRMNSLGNWWAMVSSDYFDATYAEHIGYWRPLTKLSWLLETVSGSHRNIVYNAVQIVWLIVAALGVMRLATVLGASNHWAVVGGLFFGLHPAIVEPACLVMARSDLVCGAAVIWSLVGWWMWRNGVTRWPTLHVVATLTAILSKETAVVLPLVLLIWEITQGAAWSKERVRSALVFLFPVALVMALYLVLRAQVLGRIDSVGVNLSPARLLSSFGSYAEGILPFPLESTVRNMSPEEARSAWPILRGVLALGLGLGAFALARRHFRPGIGLLMWAVASLALVVLPAQMRVPGGATLVVLADRWLLHAVAAVAVALPVLGQRHLETRGRTAAWILTGAWALLAVLAGPAVHAPYADGVALLDQEDSDFGATPERFRTPAQACSLIERQLIRARLSDDLQSALLNLEAMEQAHCETTNADVSLLQPLLQSGDVVHARQIADRVLKNGVNGRVLSALPFIGWALLETGDTQRAAKVLQQSFDLHPDQCSVQFRLAQARAALGAHAEAARLFEMAFHCAGAQADVRWLLVATDLALQGNDRALAQRMLKELESVRLPPELETQRQRLLSQ